jgi:hypothetical protein
MKARIIPVFGVLILLAGSCIPSLFPLYTKKDIVFDDRIIGTWDAGGNSHWIIDKQEFHPDASFMDPKWTDLNEESDPENVHYRMIVREWEDGDTVEAVFILTLLELDGQMYVNFSPHEYDLHHGFLYWHMVDANNFAKIGFPDDQLTITYFDPDYLEDLIEKNRIRISHVWLDDFLLLTASTRDLQKFVIKYADEENALLDADSYERL